MEERPCMVLRAKNRTGAELQTWVQGGEVVPDRDVATAQYKAGKGFRQDQLVYTKFSPSSTHASH